MAIFGGWFCTRTGVAMGVGLLLLASGESGAATLSISSPESGHGSPARLSIDNALNQVVLPLATPSFVGGQGPPMEVTPGNRFMKILSEHLRLWQDDRTGLALSSDQKSALRKILVSTRSDLIGTDATDLRFVELFEAALAEKDLPVAELDALNARIGEVEGREGMRFVAAIKEMQAVLTEPQINILKQKEELVLPSADISLTPALQFADRILALRWQLLMKRPLSDSARRDLDARYTKARDWLFSLASEKTVYDRKVDDLLHEPFVDMGRFYDLERKAGPLEVKFWGTFLRIVRLLSPPVPPSVR